MQNFDIAAKYGWHIQLYSVVLSDNVQTTLPTGIVSVPNAVPVAVFIVQAVYPSTGGFEDKLVAMSWDVDSDNKPRVTPQFSNDVTNVNAVVAVAYLN